MSMNPYQGLPFEKAHPLMRAAAIEALRLDPTLAEAHVARGWVHAREFEWAEAERAFRRAIGLNPRAHSQLHELLLCDALAARAHGRGRAAAPRGRANQSARRAAAIRAGTCADQRQTRHRTRSPSSSPCGAPTPTCCSSKLYWARALMLAGRTDEALPLLERRRSRLVDPGGATASVGGVGRMSGSGAAQTRRSSHKSTISCRCVAPSSTGRSETPIGCSAASRKCASANHSASAI